MNAITPLPCPSCGGTLQDGVFSEKCPFCGQALDFSKCPVCGEPLTKVRQKRQRVAYCESCGWLQVQQGLDVAETEKNPSTPSAPVIITGPMGVRISPLPDAKICQKCGTQNRPDANFCKQCGGRF